jgi:hypothetical protein
MIRDQIEGLDVSSSTRGHCCGWLENNAGHQTGPEASSIQLANVNPELTHCSLLPLSAAITIPLYTAVPNPEGNWS